MEDMTDGQLAEFNALRGELLQWQGIRLAHVSGLLAFFGVFASFTEEAGVSWPLLPMVMLAASGWVAWLCRYAGSGNAKIGTYIEVFLERSRTGSGAGS